MQNMIIALFVALAFYLGCIFLDKIQTEHKQAVPGWLGFLFLMGIVLVVGGILRRAVLN